MQIKSDPLLTEMMSLYLKQVFMDLNCCRRKSCPPPFSLNRFQTQQFPYYIWHFQKKLSLMANVWGHSYHAVSTALHPPAFGLKGQFTPLHSTIAWIVISDCLFCCFHLLSLFFCHNFSTSCFSLSQSTCLFGGVFYTHVTHINGLHLYIHIYSAFLVSLTTQSVLRYKPAFTPSHTGGAVSGIGVQYLARGHFRQVDAIAERQPLPTYTALLFVRQRQPSQQGCWSQRCTMKKCKCPLRELEESRDTVGGKPRQSIGHSLHVCFCRASRSLSLACFTIQNTGNVNIMMSRL